MRHAAALAPAAMGALSSRGTQHLPLSSSSGCFWTSSLTADFEYEVAWQGLASIKFNRWLPRAELVEKGFRKFVVECDQRLAAAALGNDARPLSKEAITKFLQDFGLEPEFGVHSNIRGLSGVWGVCWHGTATDPHIHT